MTRGESCLPMGGGADTHRPRPKGTLDRPGPALDPASPATEGQSPPPALKRRLSALTRARERGDGPETERELRAIADYAGVDRACLAEAEPGQILALVLDADPLRAVALRIRDLALAELRLDRQSLAAAGARRRPELIRVSRLIAWLGVRIGLPYGDIAAVTGRTTPIGRLAEAAEALIDNDSDFARAATALSRRLEGLQAERARGATAAPLPSIDLTRGPAAVTPLRTSPSNVLPSGVRNP